jgi:hypothetical protein
MTREWRALPLVSRVSGAAGGGLQVENVAAEALRALAGRHVRVLGVCGPRTASTRLLQQTLLGAAETVEDSGGETMLWLWLAQGEQGAPEDCRVVVTSDERDGETRDDRRARLALLLLLSSALLYCADGEVDAAAIERLDWLADVPNGLRIKPTTDDQSVGTLCLVTLKA